MPKLSSENQEFIRIKTHELAILCSWRMNVCSATPIGIQWRILTICIYSWGVHRGAFCCAIRGSLDVTTVGLVTMDLWMAGSRNFGKTCTDWTPKDLKTFFLNIISHSTKDAEWHPRRTESEYFTDPFMHNSTGWAIWYHSYTEFGRCEIEIFRGKMA